MADVKNERRQALELAISQIERQFGKGAVMRLGARGPLEEIPVVPTGALSLDLALGVGGLPRGRVSEIYGPESSGKSTLAMHVVAEAQRNGASAPTSTPSTPWTRNTPPSWASTPTRSWSRSRTPASRPWKSWTC